MAAASAATRRAAPSRLLQAARCTAGRMAEAGAATTRAAPRQLKAAARPTARRMEAAGGASRRAVPRQSLKIPAACTARCVCGAHSRSPTVRRHTNPQHTTWHPACASTRPPRRWWDWRRAWRRHELVQDRGEVGADRQCVRTFSLRADRREAYRTPMEEEASSRMECALLVQDLRRSACGRSRCAWP
jgi:hypothetical protein